LGKIQVIFKHQRNIV